MITLKQWNVSVRVDETVEEAAVEAMVNVQTQKTKGYMSKVSGQRDALLHGHALTSSVGGAVHAVAGAEVGPAEATQTMREVRAARQMVLAQFDDVPGAVVVASNAGRKRTRGADADEREAAVLAEKAAVDKAAALAKKRRAHDVAV